MCFLSKLFETANVNTKNSLQKNCVSFFVHNPTSCNYCKQNPNKISGILHPSCPPISDLGTTPFSFDYKVSLLLYVYVYECVRSLSFTSFQWVIFWF